MQNFQVFEKNNQHLCVALCSSVSKIWDDNDLYVI